jgi:histidyl-tRNA synthetase
MSKLQPVRGTHDSLPEESRKRRALVDAARHLAESYGFGEINTPIFEFSEVFLRTLGDTSDVVTKETYTFTDRGGESLTLRPEFTAAVVRSFLSNGLRDKLPLKFFYYGPAFRYERPQKGRLRQFHQIGAEYLGQAHPYADVEMIALGYRILSALGLKEKVTLELSSLGDAESRNTYRSMLVAYLNDHLAELSEESRLRLEKNPLRVLDSKNEGDRKIVANAPRIHDSFNSQSQDFFAKVREGLTALGIPFTVNAGIVRGLDYYCHTVFEFTTNLLGSQGTVLAGGRYDKLVEIMGGPETPGTGWAAGVERLLELYAATPEPLPVVAILAEEEHFLSALTLAEELRGSGYSAELLYQHQMGKAMKRADRLDARFALILGGEEIKENSVTVKNLKDGTQQKLPRGEIVRWLATALAAQ